MTAFEAHDMRNTTFSKESSSAKHEVQSNLEAVFLCFRVALRAQEHCSINEWEVVVYLQVRSTNDAIHLQEATPPCHVLNYVNAKYSNSNF